MNTISKNGLAKRKPAPPPVKDVIALPVKPSEEESQSPMRPKTGSLSHMGRGRQAADNYKALGDRLANCNDLFRRPGYASGLLLLLEDGKHVVISKGAELAPVIVDRVRVEVWKGGKKKGSKIAAAHLNTMLGTETFLGQFRRVDLVTTTPAYLPDFTLTRPGLNEGDGQRILYVGPEPVIADSSTPSTPSWM